MNKILKKSVLILGLLAFASCNDYFDEEPVNSTTRDTFFTSETALETYSYGLLNSYLPSAATLAYGDQISDIAVAKQTDGYLRAGQYSAAQATNWSKGNWSQLYDVNYFLKYMQTAKGKVGDDIFNHYQGVGKFWRAWFYWNKVKTFGDVPLYTDVIEPDDEAQLYKGRDSRDVVMTQVLEDLDYACDYCSIDPKFVDKNVINKYVALALKARICLYEGTFRKYHKIDGYEKWLNEAIKADEELMNNSPYDLLEDPANVSKVYSKLFLSEAPQRKEVILPREYNAELNAKHDLTTWFASPTAGNRLSATKSFMNMYLNLDGTRFTDKADYNKTEFKDEFKNRDWRMSQSFLNPEYEKTVNGVKTKDISKTFPNLEQQNTWYRVAKWSMPDNSLEGGTWSYNSLPVFRFAEILLNYAEAKAELGQMDSNVWDITIRRLRERSGVNGAAPTTADPYLIAYYTNDQDNTQVTDMWILEIRRERTIELFLENTRRDDLWRWRMCPLMERPYDGIYVPEVGKEFDLNGDGVNDICFYSVKHPKPASAKASVTYVEIHAEQGDKDVIYGLNQDNCVVYLIDRKWEPRMYYYPIPQTALNINPNLGQNEGW